MGHVAFLRNISNNKEARTKLTSKIIKASWFKVAIISVRLFIWSNFNPLPPRMLCAKFGWNWQIGSGKYRQCIFAIISPWKGVLSFVWTNKLESFFTQRCFVPNFVEISPGVWRRLKLRMVYRQTDGRSAKRRTTGDQKSSWFFENVKTSKKQKGYRSLRLPKY